MLVQTLSLGSSTGSKRLRAVSAIVSRSRTKAAQSGCAGEELLQPRILADLAIAGGEEFGEIVFELVGLKGVEVDFVRASLISWPPWMRPAGGGGRVAEQFAKLEAGLVQLGLAVSGGAVEHGGDLIMLEAFDVVQDKDHAVAGR